MKIVSGNKVLYEPTRIQYPAGEVGVSSTDALVLASSHVTIRGNIFVADDLIVLGGLVDLIRSKRPRAKITFDCGYLAYGRQDKRTQGAEEALGCDVIANFINSLSFTKVLIDNPHSESSVSKIKNLEISTHSHLKRSVPFILSQMHLSGIGFKDLVLIAPDQNALRMAHSLNSVVKEVTGETLPVYHFIKTRDPNGILPITTKPAEDINVDGKHVLIFDDICDGGGSFVKASVPLNSLGAASISLYTSHGLYTREGIEKDFKFVFTNNLRPNSKIDVNSPNFLIV